MDLPLLLAGPILRRVEPTLASVWLALRHPCDVTLQIWEGLVAAGQPNPMAQSPTTPTLRVGEQLHIVQVTVEIPPTAGVSFQADSLYSYDVKIHDRSDDTHHDLNSLHMLERGVFDGFARLPLGFDDGMLPSFAPPPSRLADLNLIYGSCRRPGHPTPDALAMVDDLIFGMDETTGNLRYRDARARPHQLFLGGDQVYADDVDSLQLLLVAQRALELIGTVPGPVGPVPVEHLPVDSALLVNNVANASGPNPRSGFAEEKPDLLNPFDPFLPADRVHFPEGRRLDTTRIDAQFTSSDGSNHVLSLGEFAALYLSAWSPALWGEFVTLATFTPDAAVPANAQPFEWDKELPPFVEGVPNDGAIMMPRIEYPRRVAGHLYIDRTVPKDDPEKEQKKKIDAQRSLREQFSILQNFRRGLEKVQRVLANVPTYMIFDDHDVTDDYFLNPVWRKRVLDTKLGAAILGNGMIAYALFQDWGNDPVSYRTGAKAELLAQVAQLFPPGLARGPSDTPFFEITRLLGHDQVNLPQTPDGAYLPAEPPLKWHFTIDGPKHRAVVFDNRTRRSYISHAGPPGNVAISALADQLPLPPLPAGREVLIVVAPLQVIGPPVLDEIVAPLSYRVFDAKAAVADQIAEWRDKPDRSNLDRSSLTGLREMTGTNPDAIEAWSFDAKTFEYLMERLEPYRRVVLLSGDVHYSAGTLMSYWRGNQTKPARFAQFTSSGLKNVMPAFITFVDKAAGFAQQLVRANLGTERLGWDQPADDLVIFPPGRSKRDLRPVMRSKLTSSPVLLPSWGWPDDNTQPGSPNPALATQLNPAKPPDWRWRVKPLLDERRNTKRPVGIQIKDLDETDVEAKLNDPAKVLEGYQLVASRHQYALSRMRNARQILFRGNVGRVRFEEHPDGRLDAIHELYTAFKDPDDLGAAEPVAEKFMVQRASLGPEDEDPPTRLRQKAIEVV